MVVLPVSAGDIDGGASPADTLRWRGQHESR